MLDDVPYLAMENRQVRMERLPDDFVVDLEVTMRDSIAHLVCKGQGQFGVLRGEVWVMLQDIVAGFAENFQVADHGVLDQFVLQESKLVYIVGITVDPVDRFSMCAR